MLSIDWLAGFYEGEGNPYAVSYKNFRLSIVQKSREVLDWIQSDHGGKVSIHINGGGYQWQLYGDEAVKLAYVLLQHMCISHKIEQMKKALILSNKMEPRSQEETEEVMQWKEKVKERSIGYNKKYWQERKTTKDYMRRHPEVIEETLTKVGKR